MDKTIYSHKQKFGSKEEGEAGVALGIQGENLRIEVVGAFEKPLAEIVDPVMKVADAFVDKIEALIPGDQKAMATAAKADFRQAIVNALKSAAPNVSLPEPETPVETQP